MAEQPIRNRQVVGSTPASGPAWRDARERVRAWLAWRRHAASQDRDEPYTGSTAPIRFDDVEVLVTALDAAERVDAALNARGGAPR